jgi:hypothetical protein
MISRKRLDEQLKKINFHYGGWGRSEVSELCKVLMPDEEIEECVNGYYEAGFALLVSTKDRVLLIDKKPLGYLTVQDMRFDMINELDLHRRLLGAQIRISAGAKTLLFTSMNQTRLSRLLNFVQNRMTQIKKDASEHQSAQKQHLEEMNEQLRLYLMAAHKQQYIDQANAIATGHVYGQPVAPAQQLAYQQQQLPAPQHQNMEREGMASPPVFTSSEARTPFEEAASNAFDQQVMQQPVESIESTANERGESGAPANEPPVQPQQSDTSSSQASSGRPMAHILNSVPKYSQQALGQAAQIVMTPQQIGLSAARRVVPIISAYTRLPLMSQRRRYRTSQPSHM